MDFTLKIPGSLTKILKQLPMAWHDKAPIDVNGVQVNAKRSLERAGTSDELQPR